MKKLLLILLCFFSLNTLTYASFPITESPTEQLSESNTEVLLSAKSSASWLGALHWAWMAFIITISVLLLLTLIGLIIVATLTGGMGG
jgi:sensor histidine kinase YesM